ncbi:hypothetical protein Q0Z83_000020 [Actinoplanes sichuanensis]|uniref:ImmA/IrrE family metallo-endopeptidase n=1 Tax=Actinoplanes sichuanensis TaxID=512349 RepID=A0ABW4A1Q1_9ACTN|nr:ImmA/IrrE family metallo-endopeptidase [Actinoplanes sichuanensis]BEL01811.1 hypothetical protein Q0Z83_000020 [Actinoplanes sichuanensis]
MALIEQTAGIDVAVLDAGPDEHGLAMRDPQRGAVFIGVARSRSPMRQRSSLAHELGHVEFDDWADNSECDWSERSPAESRADAFARHLLLPPQGLREFLGDLSQPGLGDLSAVVQRFLVSPAIAAIALEQAGFIDAATKQQWMAMSAPQLAVRFGWSDQYRALEADANQRRAPQRLLARAIKGYTEGVLSVQAIATLRAVPVDTVAAELRDANIWPVQRPVVWAEASDLPAVEVDLAALDDVLDAVNEPADPRPEH